MRRVALALLFASALWTTLPRLARMAAEAIELAPLRYEERRARVHGPLYPAIARIREQLDVRQPAGVSMRVVHRDIAPAVFANYYLYPQPTRFYGSLDDWRVMALVDPKHPRKLVRIDLGRTPEPRLMSYLDVRHEEVSATPVLRNLTPGNERFVDAIVPLAVAIDGQPGNSYVTDGVLLSDADASVTLTFYPSGESKTFALRAKEPLVLRDVVYTIAGRLDPGWLQLHSSAPLRGAFWFVNRQLKHAVAIPLFATMPPFPQRVAGGEKFWIVNPHAEDANVEVNGERHVIGARALVQFPGVARIELTADRPVLAFSADKVNARERFHWPEEAR